MHLKKLTLSNFRKFEKLELEFRPITILVGPNNSGKSTGIKALLLLKENIENGWKQVKFGNNTMHRILSFAHILHDPGKREFVISIDVELFRGVHGMGDLVVKFNEKGKIIEPSIKTSEGDIIGQFNSFLQYAPPYRSIGLKEYGKEKFPHFGKVLKGAKVTLDRKDESEISFIDKWCKNFGIGDAIEINGGHKYEKVIAGELQGIKTLDDDSDYEIRVMANGKWIDMSYLGTGSAQILYLILQIAGSSQETVIFEEPETNLHPNYQSKLAEMIVDGIKGPFGNQFIIETHSEYLIRKFQYLVATGKAKREDIQIYYFSEEESPRKLTIEGDGNLSGDFGQGFFDHAPYLITELWKAQDNRN